MQGSNMDEAAIHMDRPIYTQATLEGAAVKTPAKTWRQKIKEMRPSFQVSKKCCASFLEERVPFINTVRTYKWRENTVGDIISGVSVGILHVAQGMGFALLTNVPPVYGLYSSFFQVLIYLFFATSRHNSFGTMALISLVVGAVVERDLEARGITDTGYIAHGTVNTTVSSVNTTDGAQDLSDRVNAINMIKVGVATSVTLTAGILQMGMSFLSLGGITRYFSHPFVGGFTTGAAIHIIFSQLKFLLGMKTLKSCTGALKLPFFCVKVIRNITEVNIADLVISIICLVTLILVKKCINERFKSKLRVPVPIEIIVVVLTTLISFLAKLDERFDVKTVGPIPRGFPPPQVPPLQELKPSYVMDAFIAAIISFAISISMAKLMAKKYNYKIDNNQELFAYGITHTLSSFFLCFAGSVAPPRSMLHAAVGGTTQMANVVVTVLLLLVILAVGPVFQPLPTSVLGSIITVAVLPLVMQLQDLKKLWRTDKYDFAIWVVTWLSVTLLDMDLGLFIGIGFSLLTVVARTQLPLSYNLVNLQNTNLYTEESQASVTDMRGNRVQVFRFEAPIIYVNADVFKERLYNNTINPSQPGAKAINQFDKEFKFSKKALDNPEKVRDGDDMSTPMTDKSQSDGPKTVDTVAVVVVDFSCVSSLDTVGISVLRQILQDYRSARVEFVLANCTKGVMGMMHNSGFIDEIGEENIYLSIHDAVVALRKKLQTPDESDEV